MEGAFFKQCVHRNGALFNSEAKSRKPEKVNHRTLFRLRFLAFSVISLGCIEPKFNNIPKMYRCSNVQFQSLVNNKKLA